ncbi:MAG: nickel pincer cofactor biosynthesis protein LarC [Clostridia bacterium]|nr:nickel pincer cofactor biosynthesis protein LarC [Clostridia bacterium]
MKTLYIECSMGAAGDMLMGALLELIPDRQKFLDTMNGLGLDGVHVDAEPSVKCGITGTHIRVTVGGAKEQSNDVHINGHIHERDNGHAHEHDNGHTHENDDGHMYEDDDIHMHEHHHGASMQDIKNILENMDVPKKVISDALAVYEIIAEAESRVHGRNVSEIHFHEVGSKDAIADIVGCCILFDEIGADRVIVSPVTTGFGQVRCAHGILPVPAPATALILQGIPAQSGTIRGELCTPTGAALLKHFADEFGNMPVMATEKIGYGMGNKDFEAANCMRAMLGNTDESADFIVELCCNLDDMTPEDIGFATEIMMKAGALDVYTTAIGMKKSRPGTMLTVMCGKNDKDKMIQLIFKHTTTLGIREYYCRRTTLDRLTGIIDTQYGAIHYKEATGFGVMRRKPEYEDLKRIAEENEESINKIRAEAVKSLGNAD